MLQVAFCIKLCNNVLSETETFFIESHSVELLVRLKIIIKLILNHKCQKYKTIYLIFYIIIIITDLFKIMGTTSILIFKSNVLFKVRIFKVYALNLLKYIIALTD